MKSKLFFPPLLFLYMILFSAKNADAMKVCIVDNFGESFSLSIPNYCGAGNVKNIDGTADFSLYGAGIWSVTGTVTKSAKIIVMHCVNPTPDNCLSYASTADITMHYTGGFYAMSGSFINDCGGAGEISATGTAGGYCDGLARYLDFTQGVHSGVAATGSYFSSHTIAQLKYLPPMSEDFEKQVFGDNLAVHSFPIPMSNNATITYILPEDGQVNVAIYNHLGQVVKILVNQSESLGTYTVNWDGSDASGYRVKDGLYFITIKTSSGSQTQAISVGM
jgi:hypothetical protein